MAQWLLQPRRGAVPAECKGLAAAAAALSTTAYTIDEASIWSSDEVDFPASLGWEFFDEVHIDQTQSVSIGNTDVDGRAVIYIHERLGILAVAFRGTETGTW